MAGLELKLVDVKSLSPRIVSNLLFLERSLHDNILSSCVEVRNRIAIWALTHVLGTDSVKIGLEPVV